MVPPRRSGSFPGSEASNILSPRSSETGGLGVKMVEYVLGSSPTGKDLEPRMRGLVLVSVNLFDPIYYVTGLCRYRVVASYLEGLGFVSRSGDYCTGSIAGILIPPR
jgi:hypothetical protein